MSNAHTRTDLLPCPFCGAGETQVRENTHWTGMSSVIISVEVMHWCPRQTGVRGSGVQMRGKTEDEAVAAWNRRVSF